ncbi:TPA: hypothetical protein ACP4AI_006829 [Pseudomonas aeruginosa]|uniref:hypothetical protein n=1 Tax=Pseudomonas TaxID=286 RepID=UPI0025AB0FC7|nr:hypothetical protein [Pseudomonas asiatica]MDM9591645.1 hypothetical protein [Pseudomonas asiatica]HBN8503818.1 hypothetical protein [Pseudomonas aeruginosa]
MSAYIVDRFHISAILMFGCTGKPDATTYQILADQGQQLLDENLRSVRARYPGETFKAELFGLDDTVRKPTPLEALKLIQCLEYQSNQNRDYYATEAFRTLHSIRQAAQRKLPGWDQAQWDFA